VARTSNILISTQILRFLSTHQKKGGNIMKGAQAVNYWLEYHKAN